MSSMGRSKYSIMQVLTLTEVEHLVCMDVSFRHMQ